jgi:metal transporter CNNM
MILTTMIIVTFGEIVPQSLCYKHGLRIGAALCPLITMFWYLLFIFSKPTAFVLDKAFGEEMGNVLNKSQMKALIDYQQRQAMNIMSDQEAKIFKGAVEFADVSVTSIMVPLAECFCLDAHAVVNPRLREAVSSAGFSRVPIIDRDNKAPKKIMGIVGLVHVKDLLLMDDDHEVSLKALMPLIGREPLIVDDDKPLTELLDEFRAGASQLAVVRTLVDYEDCDPYWRHVGIITLQDLLNTIIQEELDEVDAGEEQNPIEEEARVYSNVPKVQQKKGLTGQAVPVQQLNMAEVVCVAAFLKRRFQDLFFDVSHEEMENFLLMQCCVVNNAPEGNRSKYADKRALYRRGEVCNYAVLLISGDVKVFAGREAFESVNGPWSLLGKRCLESTKSMVEESGKTGKPLDLSDVYKPDFTAYPAGEARRFGDDGVRLVLITAEAYAGLIRPCVSASL